MRTDWRNSGKYGVEVFICVYSVKDNHPKVLHSGKATAVHFCLIVKPGAEILIVEYRCRFEVTEPVDDEYTFRAAP